MSRSRSSRRSSGSSTRQPRRTLRRQQGVSAPCPGIDPRVYSAPNRTRKALTGTSRGQSSHQRAGVAGNPARDVSKLAPEPPGQTTGRTARERSSHAAGLLDRVGGIRYLPHEWTLAFATHRGRRGVRASSGVVPRERGSRPGDGATARAFAVSSSCRPCFELRSRGRVEPAATRVSCGRDMGAAVPQGKVECAWHVRATA